MSRTIGVLTIQGDFDAHRRALERLGARVTPVLFPHELEGVDALVFPGGESTTISKGMTRLGLYQPLRERIRQGLPVLGTCAGAILLAREVENHPVPVLGVLDAVAVRNAYGTQVDSFSSILNGDADDSIAGFRCVFIRAPKLKSTGPGVDVLAKVDGEPVLVQQKNILAATFHPELTQDLRVHARLLDLT